MKSNGRLSNPMKFPIKDTYWGGYVLYKPSDDMLIYLGNIRLFKQQKKHLSNCWQNDRDFVYYKIDTALCGKVQPDCFIPKRFVILQFN